MSQFTEEVVDPQTLRYAHDLAQLQRLRHAYERFLPEGLTPDAQAPAAAVREATSLFTDLRGFTALSERFMDRPDELLTIINEHMSVVVKAIRRCDGVVEKFVGDGVFATFGARGDLQDHTQRAVAAGLAILGSNELLNRKHAATRDFRLDVGVGIAVGRMVVGVIGPAERAELGVLGDTVNVASRLVSQAQPGEILLTEATYMAAKGDINPEVVGRKTLRGRSGPLVVYRIGLTHRKTASA